MAEAAAFTDSLREELGLPRRRDNSSRVTAAPSVGPGGMGLVVAGGF